MTGLKSQRDAGPKAAGEGLVQSLRTSQEFSVGYQKKTFILQFPASSGGRKKPTYLKMTSSLSRTVGVLFPLLFIYIQ